MYRARYEFEKCFFGGPVYYCWGEKKRQKVCSDGV
jgi:hypothetical protein